MLTARYKYLTQYDNPYRNIVDELFCFNRVYAARIAPPLGTKQEADRILRRDHAGECLAVSPAHSRQTQDVRPQGEQCESAPSLATVFRNAPLRDGVVSVAVGLLLI